MVLICRRGALYLLTPHPANDAPRLQNKTITPGPSPVDDSAERQCRSTLEEKSWTEERPPLDRPTVRDPARVHALEGEAGGGTAPSGLPGSPRPAYAGEQTGAPQGRPRWTTRRSASAAAPWR